MFERRSSITLLVSLWRFILSTSVATCSAVRAVVRAPLALGRGGMLNSRAPMLHMLEPSQDTANSSGQGITATTGGPDFDQPHCV